MLPSECLGTGTLSAVDTRGVELAFHSTGLRHANVTAITGAHFTLDISPRMNGVVKARKHLGGIRVTNCAPSSAIYARSYQTIRRLHRSMADRDARRRRNHINRLTVAAALMARIRNLSTRARRRSVSSWSTLAYNIAARHQIVNT